MSAPSIRAFRSSFGRRPAYATDAMVATSQPLATQAGLRAFERGGNAVDAALAAAAVLCVTEPMSTGLGGDAFAHRLARTASCIGLDAAGPGARRWPTPSSRSPSAARARSRCPGAVARLGRRSARASAGSGSTPASRDAIDVAERGFAVAPMAARAWGAGAGAEHELGRARRAARVRARAARRRPRAAAGARRHAARGSPRRAPPRSTAGAIAEAICAASWLEESDLAALRGALGRAAARRATATYEVAELPPPTQGVVALRGAGAARRRSSRRSPTRSRCVQLALEDACAHVRDGADVARPARRPEHLRGAARRRRRRGVGEPAGGTVYLCAVDGDGTAVSFIQSLFANFGVGRRRARHRHRAPEPRRLLRASPARVEPGRRPVPHDHPRDAAARRRPRRPVRRHGRLHPGPGARAVRLSAVADDGLDPQAALDRPRFRVEPRRRLPGGGAVGPRRRARARRATATRAATPTPSASAAARRSCVDGRRAAWADPTRARTATWPASDRPAREPPTTRCSPRSPAATAPR